MEENMYFTIGITIMLIAVYISYEIWWISKIKKTWLRKFINISFTLLVIPTCMTLVIPIFQKEERIKEEKFRQSILSAIYEKNTDTSEIDILIEDKYRKTFNSSEKDAKKYVKNLLSTLDSKKANFAALAAKSSELENIYYARWKPFSDLLTIQFDQIINELISSGEKIVFDIQDNNYSLVVDIAKESSSHKTIRKVTFESGNIIEIVCGPARIEQGVLIERGRLYFNAKTKHSNGFFFQFFLEDDTIWLHSNDPRYKKYNDQQVQTNINPLDDQKFCDQSLHILKSFITNIYLQS